MIVSRQPVLITGGAGFIGSALVRQWLAHEAASIVNLDQFTYAGLRESLGDTTLDPRQTIVAGDIADAALVRSLLEEHQPRAILHLAAESHVDRSIAAPPQFARTNVLGTCVLLDEATRYWRQRPASEREAFRFLHVSTDEVFGAAPGEAFYDRSPLEPNSPYAASKAAAEHFARAFAHTYGLPVVTVNPTNNYGPRQMPEKLIPRMILAAARGEPLPIYGDGMQERDWLQVDDCCCAIRLALAQGAPGARYLAGGRAIRTNLGVVQSICDLVDRRLADGRDRRRLIAYVEDRLGHDRRYAVDAHRLGALGWVPAVEFEAGLRATVDWYLDNAAWLGAAEKSLARRDWAQPAEP